MRALVAEDTSDALKRH